MDRITKHKTTKGFALPTVIITSVTMMIILTVVLVSVTSSSTAMRTQYYQRVAKEASEAGSAMANECLKKNNYIAQWSMKPLRPDTDCTGEAVTGAKAFVLDTSQVKSTFEVPAPTTANGSQVVTVKATVNTYRSSTSAQTAQRFSYDTSVVLAAQAAFGNITFGYSYVLNDPANGAQFSVLMPDKTVKSVGRNANGRLGNGSTTDVLNPAATFNLPGNIKVANIFSNARAMGRQTSVITTDGSVYSAGSNNAGQLGNGVVQNDQSTPVRFGSVLGVPGNPTQTTAPRAVYVSNIHYSGNNGTYATFVMADDNKIYSAGKCTKGVLGFTCTDGTNVSTPGVVALPAPTSDPNTQPDTDWQQATEPTNFSTELTSVVRMKGGAVYGWGPNNLGVLATGNYNDALTPVRVNALKSYKPGTSTAPYVIEAKTLTLSGALYLTAKSTDPNEDGQLWASGVNTNGQLMGVGTYVGMPAWNGVCLKRDPANGNLSGASNVCGGSGTSAANDDKYLAGNPDANFLMEWWPDGTWRMRRDMYSTDRMSLSTFWCATAPSIGGTIKMDTCTGAANQQWIYTGSLTSRAQFTIQAKNGGCAAVTWYSNPVQLANCNGGTSQAFELKNSAILRPVPALPGGARVSRISSDNTGVVVVDSNKKAWATGGNIRGQLGLGKPASNINVSLQALPFPATSQVSDIFNAEAETTDYAVAGSNYNNTFFVMSDGTVYGAGANEFGQLGIGQADPRPSPSSLPPISYTSPVSMKMFNDSPSTTPGALNLRAKSVQAGYGTTVLLTTSGQIYTVGNNSNGQVGNNSVTLGGYTSTPVLNNYVTSMVPIRY